LCVIANVLTRAASVGYFRSQFIDANSQLIEPLSYVSIRAGND